MENEAKTPPDLQPGTVIEETELERIAAVRRVHPRPKDCDRELQPCL